MSICLHSIFQGILAVFSVGTRQRKRCAAYGAARGEESKNHELRVRAPLPGFHPMQDFALHLFGPDPESGQQRGAQPSCLVGPLRLLYDKESYQIESSMQDVS